MESDFDPLAKAFENDKSFQTLLKNRTFVDYINTFLSLPVFAVRVLYRRDIKAFELEEPVARTAHHVIHENVITWVRVNRCAMFLKTSICNEFRLCTAILDLPVCLKLDGYDDDEVSKFHSKYIAKVIDMQRLKGYMQGSIGENLILFWLDAERFRRQVPINCRRFVLKEICAKYLLEGAMHELSYAERERISNNIKKSLLERDRRSMRTVISSTFLLTAQRMVLQSLQVYWIPKYVLHRLNRRGLIKKRWTKAFMLQKKPKKKKKKQAKFADLVAEMKQKKAASPTDEKTVNDNTSLPDEGIMKESPAIEEIEDTNASEKDSKNRKMSKQVSDEIKPSVPLKDERVLKKRKQLSARKHVKQSVHSDVDVVEQYTPLYERVINQKTENENQERMSTEVSCKESSALIATPSINLEYDVIDKTLFPPSKLLPNIVAQDKRQNKKSTFFESVHKDKEYEADCEDNIMRTESSNILQLPLVKTLERKLSQSYVSHMMELPKYPSTVQLPFTKTFANENTLKQAPDDDHAFQCLLAALTTDQVAGQPLLEYFRETGKKIAESNLKFWTASNDVLTDSRCDDPIMRQKQYHSLIHLHLSEFSGSYVSLPQSVKQELCILLPKDTGVTKLVEATGSVAVELLSEWDDFLKYDRRIFLKKTTKVKRRDAVKDESSMLPSLAKKDILRLKNQANDSDYDAFIFGEATSKKKVVDTRRMWRAMELAISISKPKHAEILADANEKNNWTTDSSGSDDSGDEDEDGKKADKRVAGSLALTSLEYINQKQDRLKKLEDIFNKNKNKRYSINHEYVNEALFKDMDNLQYDEGKAKVAKVTEVKEEHHDKPPRPRCFQDVLMNTMQIDNFKKYLIKLKEETPLLFWCAIESMRVTCKNATTRQGRTNGIVKRFFSSANNYGENLKCNADIIVEIPNLQTVTPAMLISAQAAVSKSLEENFFAKYQQTFEESGGVTGVTLLPIYGHGAKGERANLANSATKRSFRGKTRGLWRMFTRNVISFRRGILNEETKSGFKTFLELQHQINVDAATAAKLMTDGMPPPIDVNNKKIHTSKLTADLEFWCEVGRYKDFADAVVLCAKLGNYTKDDELLVVQKAKAIVDCFFHSQIPPRVQVNVSSEIAESILQLVQNGIIERGIFHEAALSTFSTLIGFWKKYCLYRFLPLEKKIALRKQLKHDRSALILAKEKTFKARRLKKVALPPMDNEDCTKLMFSFQLGLRLGIPRSMLKRRTTFIGEDETDSNSMFIQLETPTSINNLVSSMA